MNSHNVAKSLFCSLSLLATAAYVVGEADNCFANNKNDNRRDDFNFQNFATQLSNLFFMPLKLVKS